MFLLEKEHCFLQESLRCSKLTFRKITENNLSRKILTEQDCKYMVQTLGTLLMTHVHKPSMTHCLVVSQALHRKFTFVGTDESSEVFHFDCGTHFIYIYCDF